MADNTPFQASTDPAQPKIADKEVTHSGDQAKVQLIQLVDVVGTEGAYTLREMTALDTLIRSMFSPALTVSSGSGTGDVVMVAAAGNLRLMGYSIKEDAASPAEAEAIIRFGATIAGAPLVHINLGPNESVRDWFGPGGIGASGGLFLDRVSGTTDLVLYVATF